MKRTVLLSVLALGVSARALAHEDELEDQGLEKRYWPETVTVTTTRTFTNYCGCGIPGVPTIGPVVTSTTTVISGTTTVIPTTTFTTTSGGVIVGPGSTTTVISGTTTVVPVTTTTTMTTTTTTTTTTSSSATTLSGVSTSIFTSGTSTGTVVIPTDVSTSIATSSVSTSTSVVASSTTTAGPVVTDAAYISTVLRHHNVHRANHSAPNMVWDPALAETARKIAQTCLYGHDTTVDSANGPYGQNIGAGYPANQMGVFITEGLYNSEVNQYDPSWYGPNGPPQGANTGASGHFTQVVWVASTNVGCFSADCSATGLKDKATGQPLDPSITPVFTVCNYKAVGNVVGAYGQNVLAPQSPPQATVFGNYGCPSNINCVA